MKRLFSICLLAMAWICVNAQVSYPPIEFDEEGGFSKVVEVKATAKQAFQYSRAFLSKRIKEYNKAVQVEDADAGKIQVNDQMFFKEDAQPQNNDQPTDKRYIALQEHYKITIDCKDNKIRVKVENPTYSITSYLNDHRLLSLPNEKYKYATLGMADKEHFFKQRSFSYSRMIDNLVKYIEEQVKEEDF